MAHAAAQFDRRISILGQLLVVFATECRRLSRAKKTYVLFGVQLIPVLAALVYVIFQDIDGLTMFRNIVEHTIFPFLLPLAALFYGGPAIVEEMEGRTLTYLTMRPIARPVLFFSKWLAGATVATLVVIVPILLLFAVCLSQSADMGATVESLGFICISALIGVITYTAIFALLGVIFASSLLLGVIYFVIFEMVLATLPVLELLSVKYYLRTTAGFSATDRLGFLDRLVLEEPLIFDWWFGALVASLIAAVALGIGAYIFRERQYHV
ncbi:MAG: ABC transporter permease [Bradymonadaceae bacterium]